MLPRLLSLYLVLETSLLKLPLERFLEEAIAGGVTAVQLRDKGAERGERLATAKRIKEVLAGTLFIINDDPYLAAEVNAHGVHLGADDGIPSEIRLRFPQLLIGYSVNNREDIKMANSGADYVGVGPVFPTLTKANHRSVLTLDEVKGLVSRLAVPAVAIGGIEEKNYRLLDGTGIAGIAVCGALCKSLDPRKTAEALREKADYTLPV